MAHVNSTKDLSEQTGATGRGAGEPVQRMLPRGVRFSGAEERPLFYCDHCRSSFFDVDPLLDCGNPSCKKGMCTNCAGGDICEGCRRSVWLAVANLVDQVVEQVDWDFDDPEDAFCDYSSDEDDCFPYYPLMPAWMGGGAAGCESADCAFEEAFEQAAKNGEANSQLGPEAVRLTEEFQQAGPVRLKLAVVKGGIVKTRMRQRKRHWSRPR